jgi:hypothetical protein
MSMEKMTTKNRKCWGEYNRLLALKKEIDNPEGKHIRCLYQVDVLAT